MEFRSDIPIYLQLMKQVKLQIVSGKRKPGEKLLSVRDLAIEYGVNPNTMQKALSELESEQLLYTVRTTGRYVTEDVVRLQAIRGELAQERVRTLFAELKDLGYSKEEIGQLLERYLREMTEHDTVSTV